MKLYKRYQGKFPIDENLVHQCQKGWDAPSNGGNISQELSRTVIFYLRTPVRDSLVVGIEVEQRVYLDFVPEAIRVDYFHAGHG